MKSIILLSGGIDSTVLLAERVAAGNECTALSFDYGQTHAKRELPAAQAVAGHYGIPHRVIDLRGIFGPCALIGRGEIPDGHAEEPDTTTVPGRNLVILGIAAAVADARDAAAVFFGANADDYAGYVDCRPEFVDAMAEAAARGTTRGVSIHAPFLSWSKSEIVQVGRLLKVPFELTWSCYRGEEQPCSRCGACESREEAMQ